MCTGSIARDALWLGRQHGRWAPGYKVGEEVWLSVRQWGMDFRVVIRVEGEVWFRRVAL